MLYMKAHVYLPYYLAQFFLEWEMFHTNVVQKIKTHFMFINFFHKNRAIYEMCKNMVQRYGHRWQYNTAQKRCALHAG